MEKNAPQHTARVAVMPRIEAGVYDVLDPRSRGANQRLRSSVRPALGRRIVTRARSIRRLVPATNAIPIRPLHKALLA